MTNLDYYMEASVNHWALASEISAIIFIIFLALFILDIVRISFHEKEYHIHYNLKDLWNSISGKIAIFSLAIIALSLIFFMPQNYQGHGQADRIKSNVTNSESIYLRTHSGRRIPNSIVDKGKTINSPHFYNYL